MTHQHLARLMVRAVALASAPLCADTVNVNVAADTFILNSSPDANAGGTAWIDAGRDGVGGVRQALLRFDLSQANISGTVTSAVLQLSVIKVPSQGPVDSTFDLFRLKGPWGQGNKVGSNGSAATAGEATWNAAIQGSTPWTAPGAVSDVEPASSALGLWLKGFGEGPDGGLYAFGSRWLGPSGNTGRMVKFVPAPSPAAVTTFAPADGKLTASWAGGNGPFAVQKKTSLLDAAWVDAVITNARSATLLQDAPEGFFRGRPMR